MKKSTFIIFLIPFLLIGICAKEAHAQKPIHVNIKVTEQENQRAVPYATIKGETDEVFGITDTKGRASFSLVKGQYDFQITSMGYKSTGVHIVLRQDTSITVIISKTSLMLEEINITTEEHGLGSISTINRQAIDHIQAYSLKDVLQLVPGQLASNPNLLSPQQFVMRQIPSEENEDSDAQRAAALGTQFILNGIPLSNNANMQFDPAVTFPNTAGRGLDLRSISANNIESIDVIRGIPSARYGDLTSGIVKIVTRLDTGMAARIRINPNILEASADYSKKFNNRDLLHFDLSYLSASADKRNPIMDYNRLQASFAWERRHKTLVQTHRLSGYTTLDETRTDPTSSWYSSPRKSKDQQIHWSSEFRWNELGKEKNGKIELQSSITYQHQYSDEEYHVSRDAMLLSVAMNDTTAPGFYGGTNYLAATKVDGKPLNAYFGLHTEWVKSSNNMLHRLSAGAEYRMDGNFGKGRIVDPKHPPSLSDNRGSRPEVFTNLGPMHQVSLYVEDHMRYSVWKVPMITQIGVRYDQLFVGDGKSSTFSPRLNHRITLKQGLYWNTGLGIAAKMPTLSMFYPGNRYLDLISLNHYANDPNERLGIVTTRVFSLNNEHLHPYRSKKIETGLQWEPNQGSSYIITGYYERTNDAFTAHTTLQAISYPIYGVKDRPKGELPILYPDPISINTLLASMSRPENNGVIINKGIEYTFEFPQIKSIRTQFIVNGLYGSTRSYDKAIEANSFDINNQDDKTEYIPFYATSSDKKNTRFNSSLRVVHHIPKIGFIFHILWQAVWKDTNHYLNISKAPVGVMDRQGIYRTLSAEEANSPEMEKYHRFTNTTPMRWPPLHLINLRVSKEWKEVGEFSFFVNNLFNSRPLHNNGKTSQLFRRNEPIFFGGELQLNIAKLLTNINKNR